MLTTTLSELKSIFLLNNKPKHWRNEQYNMRANELKGRWKHLLKGLGVRSQKKVLPVERILEISGLFDALRALGAVRGHDRALRLFACHCAWYDLDNFERLYPADKRPRQAIETAERFALGNATVEELADAEADAEESIGTLHTPHGMHG